MEVLTAPGFVCVLRIDRGGAGKGVVGRRRKLCMCFTSSRSLGFHFISGWSGVVAFFGGGGRGRRRKMQWCYCSIKAPFEYNVFWDKRSPAKM